MSALVRAAKVQFLRPTASQRTARSAALLAMHRRPSSSEHGPALEAVIDCRNALAPPRELDELLPQPNLLREDQGRLRSLHPLLRREAADLALDGE